MRDKNVLNDILDIEVIDNNLDNKITVKQFIINLVPNIINIILKLVKLNK